MCVVYWYFCCKICIFLFHNEYLKQIKMRQKTMINIFIMATLTSKNLFVGFSTVFSAKTQQLADLKLVEQDLLNHFYTRKGERVMMSTYGCGIWDLLFEPFDQSTKDEIIYDAQKVIESDPRVQLKNINVTEFDHGIRLEMHLYYVPLKAFSTFAVNFDRRSANLV